MAKRPKYGLLLTVSLLSLSAAGLTIASLLTEQWVISSIILNPTNFYSDRLKFGLFGGVFQQNTAAQAIFELQMTCLFDVNICALLCGPDDYRYDILWKIYYGGEVPSVNFEKCAIISPDRDIIFVFYDKHRTSTLISSHSEKYFINAGVWISTVIFLSVSTIFGLISAALSMWNAVNESRIRLLNTFGIYIYNTIAIISTLIAVVSWGIIFAASIKHNIPTYQTFIYGFTSDNFAYLGFSFYFNLVSISLYITCIFILFIRDYILSNSVENDDIALK